MARSFQFEVPKQAKGKKLEEQFLITAQTILKEQTVLRLYAEEKISTGTAAKMLDIPLPDFLRFAGAHRTSVFPDYTSKGLQTELRRGRQARKNSKD